MENRLFVAYKPTNISSNFFSTRMKRRYGVKKAGFSGTLDPFAKGVLIMAFGQYPKLFRFLKKTPKRYRATLWLGAYSPTLDIEKIERVTQMMPFAPISVDIATQSFIGEITYLPPRYCAKRVDGRRAYDLAREDKEFELKAIQSTIYECKVIHYSHPFLTFEISISEGGYVRSIGAMIAEKLGFEGCLSSLERLSEGEFIYENEKALNPLDYLDMPSNEYLGERADMELGRVLNRENFKIKEEGTYKIVYQDSLSIVEITENGVEYLLNNIKVGTC